MPEAPTTEAIRNALFHDARATGGYLVQSWYHHPVNGLSLWKQYPATTLAGARRIRNSKKLTADMRRPCRIVILHTLVEEDTVK